MVIVLNRRSNNGRGARRWEECRAELESRFIGRDYAVIDGSEDLGPRLKAEFDRGERVFVAAGGDGTVNYLLNTIMATSGIIPQEVILGAVGLGSSNDFHKPYSPDRRTRNGVYARVRSAGALPHNVGQVDYVDEHGAPQRSYFIINGSIGIIAFGNHLFNSDERIVGWLKPRWVPGTIWYATFKSLLAAANVPVRLSGNGRTLETDVTTLSIIINPNFTGSLSYDCGDYSRRDTFGIALCERMGTFERLRILSALSKTRFRGAPKTRFWESPEIDIEPHAPTPLEMDGEVVLARAIRIRLLKGVLRVCQ